MWTVANARGRIVEIVKMFDILVTLLASEWSAFTLCQLKGLAVKLECELPYTNLQLILSFARLIASKFKRSLLTCGKFFLHHFSSRPLPL